MKYRKIGQIVGMHGIKGECKVLSFTDFAKIRFQVGNTVYFYLNDEYVPHQVRTFRFIKDRIVVSFEEFPTRTEIEPFQGTELYTLANEENDLEPDHYYIDQIVGLKVYSGENYRGDVTEVIFMKAHPVIRVVNGKESTLIPFVGAHILEVDLENKILRLNPDGGY